MKNVNQYSCSACDKTFSFEEIKNHIDKCNEDFNQPLRLSNLDNNVEILSVE